MFFFGVLGLTSDDVEKHNSLSTLQSTKSQWFPQNKKSQSRYLTALVTIVHMQSKNATIDNTRLTSWCILNNKYLMLAWLDKSVQWFQTEIPTKIYYLSL